MACDMPKPCKFPFLEKVPVDHKEVDLAPHPVVCLVLQVVDAVASTQRSK